MRLHEFTYNTVEVSGHNIFIEGVVITDVFDENRAVHERARNEALRSALGFEARQLSDHLTFTVEYWQ